jgi:hypothetical protein
VTLYPAELDRRLNDLWATLGQLGAAVDRGRVDRARAEACEAHQAGAHEAAMRRLVAHEAERVRVLTSPEAGPPLARLAWRNVAGAA